MSSHPHPDDKTTWSLQEGVDFETAQEILAGLIAEAGRKISQARQSSADDQAAQWEDKRRDWADRRLVLSPTDAAAVQTILAEEAAVLRSLQQGS